MTQIFNWRSGLLALGICLVLTSTSPAQIAFISDRDGNPEIYVMDTNGRNSINLTNHPAEDVFPSWSPDRTKITFTSTRDGNQEIYVMNADGTNPVNLTNHPARDEYPSWSPDGTKVVFQTQRYHRIGNIEEIAVMDADGANLGRLTRNNWTDSYPSWSPDGRQILFNSLARDQPARRDAKPWGFFLINARGQNLRRLTTHWGTDRGASWSPDGTKFVYESDRNGNWEIYVMNANAKNRKNLTNRRAFDIIPCWSPDERRIAFSSNRDGAALREFDIYVMNADGRVMLADGGKVIRLTKDPAADYAPTWWSGPLAVSLQGQLATQWGAVKRPNKNQVLEHE